MCRLVHTTLIDLFFMGCFVRMHACTHARTHARTHPRTHARTHARTHTCTNKWTIHRRTAHRTWQTDSLFQACVYVLCALSSAAFCNKLQHTTAHWATHTLQHTAPHCNTLQHTATHCNTLQHTAKHCNTLQHTAKHCKTLQHTTISALYMLLHCPLCA